MTQNDTSKQHRQICSCYITNTYNKANNRESRVTSKVFARGRLTGVLSFAHHRLYTEVVVARIYSFIPYKNIDLAVPDHILTRNNKAMHKESKTV